MNLFHFLIATVLLVGVWLVIRASLDGASTLSEGNASGKVLTTSELQQIVEQAVDDATRPLERKVDRLQEKLDALDRRSPPEDDSGSASG